ncbi:MAG: hypothetical protein Q9163_006548 [Psora crenata]
MPRQELPADSSDLFSSAHALGAKDGKRIISPSISSASVDGDTDAAEERRREALSPSPEVDLSNHEFDGAAAPGPHVDFVTPPPSGPSFSGRSSLTRDGSAGPHSDAALSHHHRATSPPLEGDEKEFTQTASSVRMRGMSLDAHGIRPTIEVVASVAHVEENEEDKAQANQEAVEALFGTHHHHHPHHLPMSMLSSSSSSSSLPVRPLHTVIEEKMKVWRPDGEESEEEEEEEDVVMQGSSMSIMGDGGMGLTWDTREPEDIQLEDLDDLFGAC